MHASRSLATVENRYSQLHKEGLANISADKKFHQHIYSRKFMIYSDHKPLQQIFGESKPVRTQASAGLQRWALTLGGYNYDIHVAYHPGKELGHADGLSCLSLPQAPAKGPLPGEAILLMENLQMAPVNAKKIQCWTDRDPVLS